MGHQPIACPSFVSPYSRRQAILLPTASSRIFTHTYTLAPFPHQVGAPGVHVPCVKSFARTSRACLLYSTTARQAHVMPKR